MLNIIRSAFCIVKRCISSKEAAAHLRPFYFAVHPDRFRSHPSVYSANEVALQEYNQYFNTICSKTGPIPKPISLRFFIRDSDKSDRFREIVLLLRGTDVFEIIAITLRAFGLPTDGVPRLAKLGQNSYTTYSSAKETVVYTLFDFISKRRNEAIKAREVHRAFTVEASIQIKYLKEKFGIIEILWCSGWDEQSFVVKLKNLHMLSTMIPLNELEMFYNALRDRKLRFGDSSYACFDGGIQLSVRDVLEGWRTVLLNVSINRGLIETKQNNAQSTLAIISRLLNGAKVIVADDANLCEIIDHLEIFEKRMSSFSDNHRGILKSLCFVGMEVVIYGYCDSAFHSPNGRLTIPHYVFADELIEYLNENATELERRLKQFRASSDELKSLREYCIGCLNLENLTWEEKLSLDEVKESMERLKDVNIATRKSLSGLSIHLSSVEDCSVTNYGVIIVPVSWTS